MMSGKNLVLISKSRLSIIAIINNHCNYASLYRRRFYEPNGILKTRQRADVKKNRILLVTKKCISRIFASKVKDVQNTVTLQSHLFDVD